MKFKPQFVKELREGRLAVTYNLNKTSNTPHRLNILRTLLEAAFDYPSKPSGSGNYYRAWGDNRRDWTASEFIETRQMELEKFLIKEEMNKNIINTQQFRTIHEAACETWKKDLVKWYSRDIAIEGKTEISEDVVTRMFDEANDKQREVLTNIFGQRQVTYRVGDWVTLIYGVEGFSDGTKTKQVIDIRKTDGYLAFEGVMLTRYNTEYNYYNPHRQFIRPATGSEIEMAKPRFKVGDWVVWSGCTPITTTIKDFCLKESGYWNLLGVGQKGHHDSCSELHLRLATEDEIEKARVDAWKEGEPYLVNIYGETDSYQLLYSASKYQHFFKYSRKSGHTVSTPSYKKLDTLEDLPVN